MSTHPIENAEAFTSVVYDAAAVPGDVWYNLQRVHVEALRADLPRDEWDRAATIANLNQPDAYAASRVDPNTLVDDDWGGDQLFAQPHVTVMYENNEIVGGVVTANNTSGNRLPQPFRPLESRAKMLLPPQWDKVPLIGGKKYVHLREAFAHPDLRTEDGTNSVALTGLWHSLEYRHPNQTMSAYTLPDDPADRSMVALTEAIDMNGTETRPNTLPGYRSESRVLRVTTGVTAARARIEGLLGSQNLDALPVTRRTNQDVERAERFRAKLLNKAYDDQRRARHEVPGK